MSNQFQNPNVFLSSPNGFRTLRHGPGPAQQGLHGPGPGQQGLHTSLDPGFSPSRQFQHHQGHHGTLPRNFTHGHHSLPGHQLVTNGSLGHQMMTNTSLSPAMTHSTPLRPEWEASPVVRLPDWGSAEPRSFPADYGLPVSSRRPEVHLAHNPLDTLREEEGDFQGGPGYSSGAIHALEMLNQVDFNFSTPSILTLLNVQGGGGYAGFKSVLDNSSSQESSGRGSSSSGSSKVKERTYIIFIALTS